MGSKSSRERFGEDDTDEAERESVQSTVDSRPSTDQLGRGSGTYRSVGTSTSTQRTETPAHRTTGRDDNEATRGSRDTVDYDPGPGQRTLSTRYGIDIRKEDRARRLQRLESDFGSDRVRRWADEGMPVETMGKPRDMQAFRRRQSDRPSDMPTDIERRNEASRQRNAAGDGDDGAVSDTQVPDIVRAVVSSRGTSLNESVQREMTSKMGGSFEDVRVHTGARAAKAAEAINARAFTVGNHIAFNNGEYDPGSTEGQRLLAHELTHVRQQTDGAVSLLPADEASQADDLATTPRAVVDRESDAETAGPRTVRRLGTAMHVQPKLQVGSLSSPAEREAERVAEAVVRSDKDVSDSGIRGGPSSAGIQRQPKDGADTGASGESSTQEEPDTGTSESSDSAIVTVEFNAFIPGSYGPWVPEPPAPDTGVPVTNCQFKTDERSFGERGTSRIYKQGTASVSTAGFRVLNTTGGSYASHRRCKRYPKSAGLRGETGGDDSSAPDAGTSGRDAGMSGGGRAQDSPAEGHWGPVASATASENGSESGTGSTCGASFNFVGNGAYPFLKQVAPTIDFDVNVNVLAVQGPNGVGIRVDFAGSHNMFPGYEGIVEIDGNRSVEYTYDPQDHGHAGPNPINLGNWKNIGDEDESTWHEAPAPPDCAGQSFRR